MSSNHKWPCEISIFVGQASIQDVLSAVIPIIKLRDFTIKTNASSSKERAGVYIQFQTCAASEKVQNYLLFYSTKREHNDASKYVLDTSIIFSNANQVDVAMFLSGFDNTPNISIKFIRNSAIMKLPTKKFTLCEISDLISIFYDA